MFVVIAQFRRRELVRVIALLCIVFSTFVFSSPAQGTSLPFPVGTPNTSEPSALAPPSPTALTGYHETYVTDFGGKRLPSGWDAFNGIPGGDPGGQFNFRHIVVAQGLLRLKVWRDPKFQNRWVTAGLCNCGHPMLDGAFFVRSRLTGFGPNTAELLWPDSPVWPPEVDFNENLSHLNLTTGTLHWPPGDNANYQILHINMLKWHTWGVVWTPTSITYTVDGRPWHVVKEPGTIPTISMDLNLEQRTMCSLGRDCPTAPSALVVDWVVQYQAN